MRKRVSRILAVTLATVVTVTAMPSEAEAAFRSFDSVPKAVSQAISQAASQKEIRYFPVTLYDYDQDTINQAVYQEDKAENPTTDFFDMDYTHLPIRMRDPNSDVLPEKPIRFDEMKKIAAVLSKGLPHLRVDFYCANGRLYVGELTFYHCSGFAPIQPEEWAIKMGDWIKLPTSK